MALIKPSTIEVTVLLCLIIFTSITSIPVNAYYGYPAPRHSEKVTHEATSMITALNIIIAWLKRLGESTASPENNLNTTKLGSEMLERVTSPSKYALLVGALQLKALKVLTGLNPVINEKDIMRVLNASINYMVMQGTVNSTERMWGALTGKTSCQVALNYVALSVVRASQKGNSMSVKVLRAIAMFQEALATRHYANARAIMRETAGNFSLVVAAYMACQLPPQAINEETQFPNTNASQVGSQSAITAEDILKAVAVLERLGPKAVEILGKVPVSAVVTAVSKVPLSALRKMSVDEIVKAIENASASNEIGPNRFVVTSPSKGETGSQGLGSQNMRNSKTSEVEGERPTLPRQWIRPQLLNSSRTVNGTEGPQPSQNAPYPIHAIPPAVGTLVDVVKSVNLPATPRHSTSLRWWSITRAKEENVNVITGGESRDVTINYYVIPPLTALLGIAVLAALALTLRTRRKHVVVKPLPKVTEEELPAVIKEFWEAINIASTVSGVELRPNLTHREAVNETLHNLREDVATALLKLTALYEGVRYAGVKVTRELSGRAQELLQEVKVLLETK